MLRKFLMVVLFVPIAVSIAGAEVYQWVDSKGVVTFKDTPPPPSKKKRKVKTYTDNDFAPAPSPQPVAKTSPKPVSATPASAAAAGNAPQKKRFTGTVEVYMTDWCGYCKNAEKYLKDKGVPYVAYNIEKDAAAKQRHKELGGRGVPLILIGSNKMDGFSPALLDYYLNNGN